MVDSSTISTGLDQFGQQANQAATAGAFFMLVVLLGLLFVGIIAFFIYKRSFNIDIIFVPFNDQPVMTGLKGKDYFTGKGKEYRFKIWSARRHKIKYNEEAVEPNHITIHKTINGKIRRLIWMGSDSNGMLVPIKITPDVLKYTVKTIDDEGRERSDEVSTRVLKAKYNDVDVSWLQMERNKWSTIFKNQDKMVFWGLIIVGFIMLLALGSFMWGVNKNAEVAETNQLIATEQAKSNALIVETICLVTEKCLNTSSTTQSFNSVIPI